MFCEIVTDVRPKDSHIIMQNLQLKDTSIFTDNMLVEQAFRQSGYNISEFRRYFGYVNPELYAIYKHAITDLNILMSQVKDIQYSGISVIDGLKSYLLEVLILLAKAKSILERKKDTIFIFSNLAHHHFSIHDLAKKMGYQSKYGVSTTSKSDVESVIMDFYKYRRLSPVMKSSIFSVDFRQLCRKHKDIFNNKQKHQVGKEFVPDLSEIDLHNNPDHAFFLINNDEDFYLQPVYPVLHRFLEQKKSCTIFTFSQHTAKQLEEMQFAVTDLSSIISKIADRIVDQNKEFIKCFFDKVTSLTGDHILVSCLGRLPNDAIVSRLAKILAVIAVVRSIFDKHKFKSVLVDADGVSENDLVCGISRVMSVPTYSIYAGATTEGDPRYGVMYSADHLLISGPRLKEELKSLGIEERRLLVTGNPRYDYVVSNNSNSNISEEAIRSKKKLIMVAMSRVHDNDEEWMIELIHYCNKNGYDVMIKFHPAYKYNPDYNIIAEQKITKIRKACLGLLYEISYEADLREKLPIADILITEYSLVGVEASLLGKPIIVANMSDEKFYPYSLQFHNESIALYATNSQELFDCINKLLSDNKIDSILAVAREKFNYEFNYLNDGNATERVFKILTTHF